MTFVVTNGREDYESNIKIIYQSPNIEKVVKFVEKFSLYENLCDFVEIYYCIEENIELVYCSNKSMNTYKKKDYEKFVEFKHLKPKEI